MATRIGLTGGIGSGKSSVAACFAGLGIQVIDADQIARQLCMPDTPEFARILAYFGDDIVDATGHLDRKKLGRVVFADAQKREHLESILHPPIRAEMFARAQRDEGGYCILAIPLLVESGQYGEMDRVVTVSCERDVRMQRLEQQRDMSREEIERVMRQQASEEDRLAIADDVIDNNGTVDEIEPQVKRLHDVYLELVG